MSSARCLNWSRPPPGRHPALRKQVSCSEPSPPSSSSSSSSAYSPPSLAQPHHPVRTPGPEADFCHQFLVTGAIIHANRFQTYHTYDQARRGGSASLVRPRTHESPPGRHRPASASVGQRTPVPRGVLCKQLSLDQSILGQSSFPAATVASGGGGAGGGGGGMVPVGGEHPGVEAALLAGDGERAGWNGLNRKQQRVAAGSKTDGTDLAGGKKALKPGGGVAGGKDSRINIKIFLGQTVQQDSSDTGVSDTEGTGPGGASNGNNGVPPRPPGGPTTPANVPTETSASYTAGPGAGKPKATNGNATGGTNASPSSASSNGQQQPHSGTGSNGVPAGGLGPAPNAGNNASGRNSSLAQRRAQFQANRQNSEAHDRRQPPLVRALSAPIRPADPDTARFLQGKKKPRRRKVLREKDEYNICEEDEFSDDADSKASAGGAGPSTFVGAAAAAAAAAAGKPFPPGLPLRSRSVLGGAACDIETLVSLLSSGGSDSEKEQEPAPASSPSPTTVRQQQQQQQHLQQFPSAVHLPAKGRAPMLKKAGKSVSFQETDLKPAVGTAGLNRDYRKPSFQSAVANRMRRTQQLVSTLNAFQLKDKDRDKGGDKDSGEDRYDRASSGIGTDGTASAETLPTGLSSSTSSSKTESSKAAAASAGTTATNGDLQTPKEQECYRLFLKMSKKGLAVSYDTILRGMLTPTELRVLQKKKSREQQRNGSEQVGDTAETPSPENGPGFDGGAEAMAFEEIRGLKELHFDRNAQATQDAGQAPVQLQAADPALGDGKKSEPEDDENTS